MRKTYITPNLSCAEINEQTAVLAASGEPSIIIDKNTEIEENLSRKSYNVWDDDEECGEEV